MSVSTRTSLSGYNSEEKGRKKATLSDFALIMIKVDCKQRFPKWPRWTLKGLRRLEGVYVDVYGEFSNIIY